MTPEAGTPNLLETPIDREFGLCAEVPDEHFVSEIDEEITENPKMLIRVVDRHVRNLRAKKGGNVDLLDTCGNAECPEGLAAPERKLFDSSEFRPGRKSHDRKKFATVETLTAERFD
jgi:hypothetical protein